MEDAGFMYRCFPETSRHRDIDISDETGWIATHTDQTPSLNVTLYAVDAVEDW